LGVEPRAGPIDEKDLVRGEILNLRQQDGIGVVRQRDADIAALAERLLELGDTEGICSGIEEDIIQEIELLAVGVVSEDVTADMRRSERHESERVVALSDDLKSDWRHRSPAGKSLKRHLLGLPAAIRKLAIVAEGLLRPGRAELDALVAVTPAKRRRG